MPPTHGTRDIGGMAEHWIGFRKCVRRNAEARWKELQAGPPRYLKARPDLDISGPNGARRELPLSQRGIADALEGEAHTGEDIRCMAEGPSRQG